MIEPIETLRDMEAAKALVMSVNLPVADVALSSSQKFFGFHDGQTLVAMVGVECYGPHGLLRSLAVMPSHRKQGLASALVRFAENYAASQDIVALYLLTTTAENFFIDRGYTRSSRGDAPPSIAASAQFSGLCPASSALLSKSITRLAHD